MPSVLSRILSAILLCLAIPAFAQSMNLKIGIAGEPYPPFTIKSADGKWSGFEIDLVQALCSKIQAKCNIVETAWDGIIPALNTGRIDVIFNSMSITPERSKTIAFSVPYYTTQVVFLGSKSLKLNGIRPADVKGKLIGVQTSTPNAEYLKKYYTPGSKIKIYNTQDDVNADLIAGRIDLQIVDEVGVIDFLKTKEAAMLEKKGMAANDPLFGEGIGAGLRKNDTALKAKLDAAIREVNGSGEFKKIQARYFDIDLSVH